MMEKNVYIKSEIIGNIVSMRGWTYGNWQP